MLVVLFLLFPFSTYYIEIYSNHLSIQSAVLSLSVDSILLKFDKNIQVTSGLVLVPCHRTKNANFTAFAGFSLAAFLAVAFAREVHHREDAISIGYKTK